MLARTDLSYFSSAPESRPSSVGSLCLQVTREAGSQPPLRLDWGRVCSKIIHMVLSGFGSEWGSQDFSVSLDPL